MKAHTLGAMALAFAAGICFRSLIEGVYYHQTDSIVGFGALSVIGVLLSFTAGWSE